MSTSIDQAAKASSKAQGEVERALDLLQRSFTGRVFNGFGVYDDPSLIRGDLRDAHAALGRAMAVLAAVPWPTADEYDAADAVPRTRTDPPRPPQP